MEYLSISEMARACRLSVPALRRYDELGLLAPARVDPASGYRWYEPGQVREGSLIRLLRQLDVPVAAIRRLLAAPDPSAALALLDAHWAEVERRIAEARRVREYLGHVLGGWDALVASFAVATADIAEQPVLSRRRTVSVVELHEHVEGSVRELRARAAREGLVVTGPPLRLFHGPVDEEHDGEVEVCLPVDGAGDAVLPGGHAVRTEACGADRRYPRVLAAYGAVSRWAHEHALRLVGPPREVERDPDCIEIAWPAVPADRDPYRP